MRNCAEKLCMTPDKLDLIFPNLVFIYGALITLVLHHPFFVALSEDRLPAGLRQQMQSHRVLALVSLVVGAFWSLQNVWL